MADLDLNRLLQGGMDLARAFGRGDDAYNAALAKRAQVEGLVIDARNKRDAAMAKNDLVGLLMESGDPADRQRALAVRGGVDPKYLGDLFSGALPNEVRTFKMMTDGLSNEDRERARRINLGLDGRASGAALKYEQVIGPDGVPRYMAFDPNAPLAQQVMTGGYSGFSTPQGRPPVQQQSWAQPGATYQTPQGISRIDPNIDPAALSLVQADMVGGGAADSYSLPARDVTPQQFYGGQGGAPVVGRRKEDETAAVEAAKQRTQLAFAPQVAEAEANTAAAKERAGTTARTAAQRQSEYINNGLAAADSLPVINRAIDLLDSVGTGGIDSVKLAATNFFGVTGADEGELSQNLGKAVLSQLRATFGAQFTQEEGKRLEGIEAGFGKSTAVNKRLLNQAKTIIERAARRGMEAARASGDDFSADEIQRSMDMRLSGDKPRSQPPRPQSGKAPQPSGGWSIQRIQ